MQANGPQTTIPSSMTAVSLVDDFVCPIRFNIVTLYSALEVILCY